MYSVNWVGNVYEYHLFKYLDTLCKKYQAFYFFYIRQELTQCYYFTDYKKKLFVPYTCYQKFWEKNALSTLYLRKLSTKFLNLKKSSKVKTVIWAMYQTDLNIILDAADKFLPQYWVSIQLISGFTFQFLRQPFVYSLKSHADFSNISVFPLEQLGATISVQDCGKHYWRYNYMNSLGIYSELNIRMLEGGPNNLTKFKIDLI